MQTEAEARARLELLARHEKNSYGAFAENCIYISLFTGNRIQEILRQAGSHSSFSKWKTYGMEYLSWRWASCPRYYHLIRGIVSEHFNYSEHQKVSLLQDSDPNNVDEELIFEFGLFMSRREYEPLNWHAQGRLSIKEGKYHGAYDKPPLWCRRQRTPSW